ncbi:unnamed protein product [Ectocarpus sp. 12 AP-2014]
MDPKSEWALGEFRDPPIELRILEHRVAGGGVAAAAAAGGGGAGGSPQQQQALPGTTAAAAAAGGRRRVLPVRTAYQGERLTGLLVVKFDVASADAEDRRSRWRQFGTELNVELEITTEAVASAGTAFLSEEPSLWRDYEGRENARDRGVLARSNRTVSLSPEGDQLQSGAELVYALDMEVQVPVDSLGQNVVLEALVSPPSGRRSECVKTPGVAAAPSRNTSGASSGAGGAGGDGGGGGSGGSNGGGGRRRGIGGDFATRLDGLFALSRVAPVRLPVRRCFLPLRVVQPITVTSRSCPSASSPAAAAAAAAAASGGAFAGAIGRCLVALEVRNDHPAAAITVHDVEVHVDATARCGDRSSSRGFSAPGKAGGGGGGGGGGGAGGGGGRGSGRRKMSGGVPVMSGGVPVGGASAPLEGLDGSIAQPPLAGASSLGGGGAPATGSFSRVFSASWVAKPPLPLELAPGEVQGFVVSISPAGDPLPPRRAGGHFESPVTFVWTLAKGGAAAVAGSSDAAMAAAAGAPAAACAGSSAAQRQSPSSRSSSPTPMTSASPSAGLRLPRLRPAASAATPTTSVYLAQWQSEQRARDEVLVRVKGQPRVKLNRVFEVSLQVRNLSDSARDLVVMFTEDPALGSRRRRGSEHQTLSLDGGGGGGGAGGGGGGGSAPVDGSDSDGDDDGGPVKDISPSTSPGHHARGAGFGHTRSPPPPPPRETAQDAAATAAAAAAAAAAAPTCLLGDLLPVDAAVPLGRLEMGAEHGATVRLTAARAGLARLSSLCLRDALTGSVYAPSCPYEVFVEG